MTRSACAGPESEEFTEPGRVGEVGTAGAMINIDVNQNLEFIAGRCGPYALRFAAAGGTIGERNIYRGWTT
jgi:hypothetical protein